jgi:hypothetical protein
MKNILKLFPSLATILSFFILPLIFGIYFAVTRFSDQFVAEQDLTYFDVQNSVVGQFFITQAWLDWFNRFMDFALWGLFAAIILIIAWLISSAKTAVHNHETEEGFRNFHIAKNTWHSHFLAVGVVKVILVLVMVFCFFSLLGQAIPLLAINVTSLLQEVNLSGIIALTYTVLLIVFLQFLLVTSVKIFKITHADE